MRRTRHLRGWIGELLKSRAADGLAISCCHLNDDDWRASCVLLLELLVLTFLEDLRPVDLDQGAVGVLVLLPVAHGGQNDAGCADEGLGRSGSKLCEPVRNRDLNSRRCQFTVLPANAQWGTPHNRGWVWSGGGLCSVRARARGCHSPVALLAASSGSPEKSHGEGPER